MNLDTLSYSDPCCIVTELAQDSEDNWFEIGRTEIINNNLNPDFTIHIDANFYFEKNQKLRFEFIDDDGGDSDDPYFDLIGTTEIFLAQIMSAKGQTITRPLTLPG
jgi:hypothetical protein